MATDPLRSISFGLEAPVNPALVHRAPSGKLAELYDIRLDVDRALRALEGRNGDYPVIDLIPVLPAAGGTVTVYGRNFLTANGKTQTFASKAIGLTTAMLTITALKPGRDGNNITVTIVQGAGALAVTVSGTDITITLAVAGSTANAVATAINADNAQTRGLVRCASGGAGTVLVAAETNLAGGVGEGFYAEVGGNECLPANTTGTAGAVAISDTVIRLTVPDLRAKTIPLYPNYNVDLLLRCGIAAVVKNVLLGTSAEPHLDGVDGATGAPAAGGADLILLGRNLTQGQTFAALTVGLTTAALTFTALKPGAAGNDFTVTIVQGVGGASVAMVGTDITVTLAAGGSTADAIATLVNANAADTDGYVRCASGGGGTVLIAAEANLAGGVGAGFTCHIGGVEALPANTTGTAGAAAITDTSATVTVVSLAGPGWVATDRANTIIETDNIFTEAYTDTLA